MNASDYQQLRILFDELADLPNAQQYVTNAAIKTQLE